MAEPKIKPFPIPISAMFQRGLRGYVANAVPLTLAAAATFGVLAVSVIPVLGEENRFRLLAVTTLGLIVATAAALPWFSYALNAARNEPVDIAAPFRDGSRFVDQLVCSFWFWAAFFLGFQYLRTLWGPILFFLVVVLYAFFGFVVADGTVQGPLRALGTSVRLGEKRRIALFAIWVLFFLFNFAAALPIGWGVNPVTVVVTVITLAMTTSISMVAWACLYDTLDDLLVPLPPAQRPQWGARRKPKKSRKSRKPRRRR
ncbi:MAG: hypothetical protein OXB92_04330 [Acidimicrobiaceae bacterium]|nr:hypothetical protein [Acidimicrobiia bacterium]MCY4493069.1 hypothetical protein [Acidimicrobiaceae bacterium]